MTTRIADEYADIARRLKALQEGKEPMLEEEKPPFKFTGQPGPLRPNPMECACGLATVGGLCDGSCCG